MGGSLKALAPTWRSAVCSSEQWLPEEIPGGQGGVSSGYLVGSGGVVGFCKPGKLPDPNLGSQHFTNPTAAHEKIAADLAHDLNLPIPPAVLIDRGVQANKLPRYCVISAVPFWPATKWQHVALLPKAAAQWIPLLSPAASAVMVFDTWLDNRDRMTGGNLVVHQTAGSEERLYAYLDQAQSMTFGWLDGPAPDILYIPSHYPGAAKLDMEVVHETVNNIERLPKESITSIVQRLPPDFLSQKRSTCIIDGLLARREQLRQVLTRKYGSLG